MAAARGRKSVGDKVWKLTRDRGADAGALLAVGRGNGRRCEASFDNRAIAPDMIACELKEPMESAVQVNQYV